MKFKVKRALDFLISAISILLLSSLLIIISVLIKITMPGPIIFKQVRVGKNSDLFDIYKFRSMKADNQAEKQLDFSKDELRITKLGKFIRRTKIDELPQLFNVLLGDMSLVGPRPTVEKQTKLYNETQEQRLLMKPGMTGLAQVNGNISNSWDKRIEYDIKYVRSFNLMLDFKIILKTFLIVLLGEDKFKK